MQDIYSVIFTHITDFPTHMNFSFVSKSTYAVSHRYIYTIPRLICVTLLRYDMLNKVISQFSSIHKLNLACTNVTVVSALGNCHTLYLACTNVIDVSALGNCHTLYLYGTKVTDVSALGNCHTLNLCGTKVTDVSALGNCHTLTLLNTKVSIVDIQKLIDSGVNVMH